MNLTVFILVTSCAVISAYQIRLPRAARDNVTKIIKEAEDRIIKHGYANKTSSSNTCGGIYSQPQFIIESPNYPSNYPKNINCLFIFKGPVCESNYTLQFLDFNLEDTLGCVSDRLEIKYKDALCGIHEGTRSYITQNGVLELNFITNEETSMRGFRILVSRSLCITTFTTESTTEESSTLATPQAPTTMPTVFSANPYIPPIDNNRPYLPPSNNHPYIPTSNNNPYPPRDNNYPNSPPDNNYPTSPGNSNPYSPRSFPYPPYDNNNPYSPPNDNKPYPPSNNNPYPPPTSINPHTPTTNNNPPSNYPPTTKPPACCATTYSDKRFYISSPGFPHSNNNPTDCTFTIYRSNPKVCRMRIHFHFFHVGDQNNLCTKGYLQIDGKLICGCHTDMKLVAPFDGSFGNTKVIRFKNLGHPQTAISGFAIEVIQDECPKRYSPRTLAESRNFHFYNDQINRVAFPNITSRAQNIHDNTEVFEAVDLGFRPRIVKHVYFFDSPTFDDNYDVTYSYNKPRDIEETSYLETTDLNALYPNSDNNKCNSFGVQQLNFLNNDVLWRNMPKCSEISLNTQPSNCKDYNFIKGYFQSPGYPHYYPKNLDLCYRFTKQRGFCKIRLIMLDFHVEENYDCSKDYLLIHGNFRYCGQSLSNTFTLFDMSDKSYEEIKFVTDQHNSGRGFRGVYEQIGCDAHPQVPHLITTTPPPPLVRPPTTPVPEQGCTRNILDGYFTIDIYDYGKDMCDFMVKKRSQDVCRLEITFVTFDFLCGMEYLLINDQRFCGKMSGRMLSFDFETDEIAIIYVRTSKRPSSASGLKLHLVGRQINMDCEVLPPVQRFLQIDTRIDKEADANGTTPRSGKKSDDIAVVLRKQYKEVCGVVMNVKASNLTDSLCNIILNNRRNVDCSPITDNTVYVPYNKSDKLELKFKNVQIVQDIEFKEITCDNKFIL